MRIWNHRRLLPLVILLIAFSVRLITLDKFEVWADEIMSVSEANALFTFDFEERGFFTLAEIENNKTLNNVILSNVRADGGNGILYIIMLYFWTEVFGNYDFSVRFLSLIFGVAVVAASYFFSRQLFRNESIALITMGLMAIHPQLITYSQETRAYSVALFFALSSSCIFFKVLNTRPISTKLTALYFLLATCAFLSHYLTIYILGTHALISLIYGKFTGKEWRKIALFLFAAIAVVSCWLIAYGYDGLRIISERNLKYVELSLADPSNTFYMPTGVYSVIAGWLQNLLTLSGNTFTFFKVRIIYLTPLLLGTLALILFGLLKSDTSHRKTMIMLLMLTISSLVYATVLSIVSGHIISFQQFYSIFSVPYFMALTGFSFYSIVRIARTNRRYRLLNYAIITHLVVMVTGMISIYYGYDSDKKYTNRYHKAVLRLTEYASADSEKYSITHSDIVTAVEVNKLLSREFYHNRQNIDSTVSGPAIVLTNTENGEIFQIDVSMQP